MIYPLEFGHEVEGDKRNPNTGKKEKVFKPEILPPRYAAKWSLSQADQLSLAGQGIKDEMVFAIRHDEKITSDYLIRLNGEIYSIDTIHYDEGRTPDAYDLIYCHHNVTKHN